MHPTRLIFFLELDPKIPVLPGGETCSGQGFWSTPPKTVPWLGLPLNLMWMFGKFKTQSPASVSPVEGIAV